MPRCGFLRVFSCLSIVVAASRDLFQVSARPSSTLPAPVANAPVWVSGAGDAYTWPQSGVLYPTAANRRIVQPPPAPGCSPLLAASVVGFAIIGYGVGSRLSHGRRTPAVEMNARYDDKILDESIPDPIFDGDSGYKGRVPYGFSTTAEVFNGRAAMMGFVIVFLQELFAGKGVLQQYGFPYDAGAVLPPDDGGFSLPPVVALVIAVVVTVGATYGGAILGKPLEDKQIRNRSNLPFL